MNASKTYQTIKMFNLSASEIERLIDMLQHDLAESAIYEDEAIEDSEDMRMTEYMIKVLKMKNPKVINDYKNAVREMVKKKLVHETS